MSADIEKAVSNYLREHDDVAALATRIVGGPPSTTGTSWVQVVVVTESPLDLADHSQEAYLQLDCYSGLDGGQPECNRIGMAVKAALNQIANVTQGDVVLNGARASFGPRDADPDLGDRQRRIVTAYVWAHG